MEKRAEIHHIQEGTKIGPYLLEKCLGQGGMAEVFLASKLGTRGFAKPVCIKKILPSLRNHEDANELFVREARLAAKLHHPNIVRLFDLIEEKATLAIVMEFVDGIDLDILLKKLYQKGQKLHEEIAIYITSQILYGLQEANSKGVIHRDISPHNILLSHSGGVKITDFGVAKSTYKSFTKTGQIKGKIAYMSPEQARAEKDLDARTDLYATGLVLYEMLYGKRYYDTEHEGELFAQVTSGHMTGHKPSLKELEPDLAAFLEKMLAPDKDKRFQNALEALNFLPLCHNFGHTTFFELSLLVQSYHERLVDVRSAQDITFSSESPSNSNSRKIAETETSFPNQKQIQQTVQVELESSEALQDVADSTSQSPVAQGRAKHLSASLVGIVILIAGLSGIAMAYYVSSNKSDISQGQTPVEVQKTTPPPTVKDEQEKVSSCGKIPQAQDTDKNKNSHNQKNHSLVEINHQLSSIASKVNQCLQVNPRSPSLINVEVKISKDGATSLVGLRPKISKNSKRCIERHLSHIDVGSGFQESVTVTYPYKIISKQRKRVKPWRKRVDELSDIREKTPF